LLERAGRDDEQARLREVRAERAGQLAADVPELRRHLLCDGARVGAPFFRRRLRRCLTKDPAYLPALVRAAHGAEAQQRWRERAICCDRIAALCSSPANAVNHAREAIRLWSLQGEENRELTSVLSLLRMAPAEPETIARAEHLARKLGRYEEVARLYQLRIDSCGKPAEKRELLVECGQLLQHQVQDLDGAIERFTQAAQLAPGDLSTLSLVIEALQADRRWDECTLLLRALIDLTDSPDVRYEARITLASILARHLDQPEEATRTARAAFTERPTGPEALAILVEAYLVNRQTNRALRLVAEFCKAADPHQQLWLLTELADAADRFLKDEQLRFRWDLAALELVVEQPELLDPLVSRYRDLKQLPRLVAIGQTMFELALLPEIQARLELALAQVLLEDLKRPRDALRMVQRTLARQPRHAAARRLCRRIVGARPRPRRDPLDLSFILSLTPAPS
jgi:tetratricopeptide (TPR) repeat protein